MQIVQFNSNAKVPYNILSNFNYAPIIMEHINDSALILCPDLGEWFSICDRIEFPSSEHMWQALKSRNYETFIKFLIGGDFGSLSVNFFSKVIPQTSRKNPNYDKFEAAEGKVKYWSKKNNVGIIAKMTVNKTHSRKLDLVGDIKY